MKDLSKKEEAARYLICGAASMAISWAAMFLLNRLAFGNTAHPNVYENLALSAANWLAGMSSAYALTWAFVFRPCGDAWHGHGAAFAKHAVSRAGTLGLDVMARQGLAMLGLNVYVSTVICAAAVTAANYMLAKWFVFKH